MAPIFVMDDCPDSIARHFQSIERQLEGIGKRLLILEKDRRHSCPCQGHRSGMSLSFKVERASEVALLDMKDLYPLFSDDPIGYLKIP